MSASNRRVSNDSVEMKEIYLTDNLFPEKALAMLRSLDKLIFDTKVYATGFGEKITGEKVWNEKEKKLVPNIKTQVTKTMSRVHEELMQAIADNDHEHYLKCIARIDAMLNYKTPELPQGGTESSTIKFYRQLHDIVKQFKDENILTPQDKEIYQKSFEDADFDVRMMGDKKNGAEYQNYKNALDFQEKSLARWRSFVAENKASLDAEGAGVILDSIMNSLLQTYQEKDLANYQKHITDILNNHCPSLTPAKRESAKVAIDTLIQHHRNIMHGIDSQWKDFYKRTLFAMVSSVVTPIVGAVLPVGIAADFVSAAGVGATVGGIATHKLDQDKDASRFRTVKPSANADDYLAGVKKQSGAAGFTVTKIGLGLLFPPAAAVLAGAELIKSVKDLHQASVKDYDILKLRDDASKKLLREHNAEYQAFVSTNKKTSAVSVVEVKASLFSKGEKAVKLLAPPSPPAKSTPGQGRSG